MSAPKLGKERKNPVGTHCNVPCMSDANDVVAVSAVVIALQDFKPTEPDCLELRAGDQILVYHADESGWSYGALVSQTPTTSLDLRKGWFPKTFCKTMDEKQAGSVIAREMAKSRSQNMLSPQSSFTANFGASAFLSPNSVQDTGLLVSYAANSVLSVENSQQYLSALTGGSMAKTYEQASLSVQACFLIIIIIIILKRD